MESGGQMGTEANRQEILRLRETKTRIFLEHRFKKVIRFLLSGEDCMTGSLQLDIL